MPGRFNNLKAALKFLQSPSGGSDNEPPSGSVLKNFKDFRDGKTDVSYPVEDSSKPGSFLDYQVQAFGREFTESPVRVPLSERANTNVGAIVTAGGAVEATTSATKILGFEPAKAVVFRPSGSVSATKEFSQITGLEYNKRAGDSYTVPFGAKTSGDRESTIRNAIRQASQEGDSITFYSENL